MGALDGRTALVTGGGTGIGLGCALRLAADGAIVTICGRRETVLAEAADRIGPNARWVRCDVTDDAEVAAAVGFAAEPSGRLDIAVANAGGGGGAVGPLVLTDLDAWNRSLALYLTGTLSVIKHAAPLMTPAGQGSVIAVSSTAGGQTHCYLGQYAAAKAGIEMLVRGAADELGCYGVRVNAVRPGLVPTDAAKVLWSDETARADYIAQMPLGRLGTPEDVAGLVRFLAGDESSWMTGVVVSIDGGQHLRRGSDLRSIFEPGYAGRLEALLGPVPSNPGGPPP